MTSPSDTDLEAVAAQAEALAAKVRGWKAGTTPTPTPTPVPTPTPTPTPAQRFTDLPNFKLLRSQTFDKDCAEGDFLKTYSDMGAYDEGWLDTSKKGTYSPDRISVKDGAMRIHVGHRGGKPGGSVPHFKGLKGESQLDFTYGRVEFTLWSDPVKNYKAAPLLWPASDKWAEGEVDFPEGNLNSTVTAYNHKVGDPANNDVEIKTSARFSEKHVYAVEWTPKAVIFFLDGKEIGRSTKPPTKPMHHVMQVEVNLDGIIPTAVNDGYVSVSDYAVWAYVA